MIKEQNIKDIDQLILFLNELPENTTPNNLLPPINIDQLKWENFRLEMNLSSTSIRACFRNFRTLIPKSRRNQIYCYAEILRLDIMIQPRSIKFALSLLFDCTRESIASYIRSYDMFLVSFPNEKSKGRPLVLQNEQIDEILNEIAFKEKQYLPLSKSEIVNLILEKFHKKVTKKWVSRLIQSKRIVICICYSIE